MVDVNMFKHSNMAFLSGPTAEVAQNQNVCEGRCPWSLRYTFLFKPEQGVPVPYDTNMSLNRRGQMIDKHCWFVPS